MDATLTTTGPRPLLRLERRLAHPAEKVWRALTEREHLEQWFPGPFDGDLVAGGKLRFDSPGHGMPPMEGEVLEADPPRLLVFTWDTDVLRWELIPDGAGCLLVLEHTFDERPDAASFCAGWETCFDGLDAAVAGAGPVPADQRWQRRHEHWAVALGLDAGEAEPVAAGTVIRFARPLTVPQPEVKPLLDTLGRPDVPGAAEASVAMVHGPGGNARLVVEQLLPPGADVAAALAAWRAHISSLAARLPGGVG